MRKIIIILICFTAFFITVLFLFFKEKNNQQDRINITPVSQPTISQNVTKKEPEKIFPIAQFQKRITKKPFGIFITPQNSPVQPERFSGYHTGVDVEYEDVSGDVPVYAICNGKVVLARWVSGYGGTMVLECDIQKDKLYIVYGHLYTGSFIKGKKVKKGEKIAILGKGNTEQTDFERKHLHFAIRKNNLDLRGYVQTKKELKEWYDPVEFLKKIT